SHDLFLALGTCLWPRSIDPSRIQSVARASPRWIFCFQTMPLASIFMELYFGSTFYPSAPIVKQLGDRKNDMGSSHGPMGACIATRIEERPFSNRCNLG